MSLWSVSWVGGTHALPRYWEILEQMENSDLKTQKRLVNAPLMTLRVHKRLPNPIAERG